jgi:hypothetical protein
MMLADREQRASQFLGDFVFSLSSTHLWRRGLGRGGIGFAQRKFPSPCPSPRCAGRGDVIQYCQKHMPKTNMRTREQEGAGAHPPALAAQRVGCAAGGGERLLERKRHQPFTMPERWPKAKRAREIIACPRLARLGRNDGASIKVFSARADSVPATNADGLVKAVGVSGARPSPNSPHA